MKESLKYLMKLPQVHRQSALVLECVAKCFFEMNDYSRAIGEYKQLHAKYPYRMEGLDYYSTTLWHTREVTELTLLAQHCSEMDKMSPETWVVIGNCFSQSKSHDEAIRRFARAVALNPHYAYAYTLQVCIRTKQHYNNYCVKLCNNNNNDNNFFFSPLTGHEHMANENFDQAKLVFREALKLDPRHYNAWYGLGYIYHYQQQYEYAIYHFEKALEINSQCVLLYCCISTALMSQNKFETALHYVNQALEIQPSNVRAKFQKANVLKQMARYDAAIDEYESLRYIHTRHMLHVFLMISFTYLLSILFVAANIVYIIFFFDVLNKKKRLLKVVPWEWKVHFQLAEVYKKVDKKEKALLCFDKAMELNPKDHNNIKQAKQNLYGFGDDCSDNDLQNTNDGIYNSHQQSIVESAVRSAVRQRPEDHPPRDNNDEFEMNIDVDVATSMEIDLDLQPEEKREESRSSRSGTVPHINVSRINGIAEISIPSSTQPQSQSQLQSQQQQSQIQPQSRMEEDSNSGGFDPQFYLSRELGLYNTIDGDDSRNRTDVTVDGARINLVGFPISPDLNMPTSRQTWGFFLFFFFL
ncbi:hypothetical protein RFI_14354 [Reticulomyxa filosa]|uniref:Uncharacterized protein n=1 Tax=Reticulomyxa filosa TaxID=46433 RepID=X6NAP4_RETFI|nr:hypothetical protein RFI_14354 [Reticulomyxa filosa]|eukprot:ETO22839.1 hypothetical protein RFI_14354 [Reticulomyxa filosa]